MTVPSLPYYPHLFDAFLVHHHGRKSVVSVFSTNRQERAVENDHLGEVYRHVRKIL
jgi:hypothetical protein